MKLSIEINDQVKRLLLELLEDGDVQNKILDIAGEGEDLDDAIDARCSDFVTVENVDDQIRDYLTGATFTTNFEG